MHTPCCALPLLSTSLIPLLFYIFSPLCHLVVTSLSIIKSHLCHFPEQVSSSLLFLAFSSPLRSLEICVESTTVEFVLLPLIRLVLIFLPLNCSSAKWMNFFNCLSEAHLHCSAQWLSGLLPAIYYEIKIDGCRNVILWPPE